MTHWWQSHKWKFREPGPFCALSVISLYAMGNPVCPGLVKGSKPERWEKTRGVSPRSAQERNSQGSSRLPSSAALSLWSPCTVKPWEGQISTGTWERSNRNEVIVTATFWCFLHARHSAKHFIGIFSSDPHDNLVRWVWLSFPFCR